MNFNDKEWVKSEFNHLLNQNKQQEQVLQTILNYVQECKRKQEAPLASLIEYRVQRGIKKEGNK